MKRKVRLTESDLNQIIKESVLNILKEEELEEGFFDKLGFLGKSGANAASGAYNKAKTAVNNAYNNTKTAVQNYKTQMNQYSQNQEQARMADKNAKVVNKLQNQIQEFLNLDILNGVSYGKKAKEQAMQLIKTLNYLSKSGFGAKANAYRNSNKQMFNKDNQQN